MQKVEAPPPSRCPMRAITVVITVTPMTLLPTSFMSLPMITSNMPASVMIPKYSTENTNRAAVGAVELKPVLIMDSTPSREIYPPRTRIIARMKGNTIKAMLGRVLLWNRVTTMATMHSSPRRPTTVSVIICTSFRLFI